MIRGFTLLELLIVIGILAILMATVAYVLNPAQMLAQARDSTRLSDVSTLNSAIGLYLATATTTPLLNATTTCTVLPNITTTGNGNPGSAITQTGVFAVGATCSANNNLSVNNGASPVGLGWVNINFALVPSGAPIGRLPIDPLNPSANNPYAFRTDGANYKIEGVLESAKYGPLMGNDGGLSPNSQYLYEIGTGMAL